MLNLWSVDNKTERIMRFNKEQLTIQRLYDKIADLVIELSKCRSENQELLSMEAYYKVQSQPLQDVIDNLKKKLKMSLFCRLFHWPWHYHNIFNGNLGCRKCKHEKRC